MKRNYKWQGEPVKVKFGCSVVKYNKEKPMYWYNYECSLNAPSMTAIIPTVKVITPNDSFVISNHYGIGVYKLLKGGWPNCTHFSVDDDSFTENRRYMISRFNDEGYAIHEAERRKWQKETYPEEYRKLEAIRSCFGIT